MSSLINNVNNIRNSANYLMDDIYKLMHTLNNHKFCETCLFSINSIINNCEEIERKYSEESEQQLNGIKNITAGLLKATLDGKLG